MRNDKGRQAVLLGAVLAAGLYAPTLQASEADGKIDPTFLYRDAARAAAQPADITTATCHYKPLFGQGDPDTAVLGSVARYGEVVVDPGGACNPVQYPDEDQIYVVLKGSGAAQYAGQSVPLGQEDYLYVPSTVSHALSNNSAAPMTVVIMGFHTQGFPKAPLPPGPLKANIADVPTEFVNGHPSSAHFRLLLGDAAQKRDHIDAGNVVTSLFVMEIDPGGTNFPHHHAEAEEIYLILDGHGEQVAGEGTDGIAARRPAKPGDAYFYRLNATVGYYSAPGIKSRILCVRSFDPGVQPRRRAQN
jgi:mannose-6-phosphate isomerase-like protein (cupin superfamily)